MHSHNQDWARVSKSSPCPICGKRDWCCTSSDGYVALCMRNESERRLTNDAGEFRGYIHQLKDDDRKHKPVQVVQRQTMDFGPMAAQYARNLVPERLVAFADGLGLPPDALLRLGIGWTGSAFSFPMHNGAGKVIGIRLRDHRTGKKFAERGGREGVFVPLELGEGQVLIAEGPTDTAAGIACGYLTIGRPSCCGGTQHIAKMTHGRDVVVIADADEPGRRGAAALASTLVPTVASVRIIEPPEGFKDLRAWVKAGATAKDIAAAIAAVEPRRLKVRYRCV